MNDGHGTRWVLGAVIVGLGLFLAGCAGTPARRIARYPELYAALPPDVQARVSAGDVAPGFTREAAFLAAGRPQRVIHRRDAAGVREVWSYSGTGYRSEVVPVRRGYAWRDRKGRGRFAEWTTFETAQVPYEFESGRIEFGADGLVTSVELLRGP